MVIWITGKSGAGKTTLAKQLIDWYKKLNCCVVMFDGDEVRDRFPTGFTDEDRSNHIMRISKFASLIEKQDVIVIIALLSPKYRWRVEAKKLFEKSCLIYVKGGELWKGTSYDEPKEDEVDITYDWKTSKTKHSNGDFLSVFFSYSLKKVEK